MIKDIVNLGQGVVVFHGDFVHGAIIYAHVQFFVLFIHEQNGQTIR
jgi:hypothetical protein